MPSSERGWQCLHAIIMKDNNDVHVQVLVANGREQPRKFGSSTIRTISIAFEVELWDVATALYFHQK